MKYLSLVLLMSLLLVKCQCSNEPRAIDFKVDYSPLNLSEINSKYDDYNSDSPHKGEAGELFAYSSKYRSSGHNFNIESTFMNIYYYYTKDYFYGVYNKGNPQVFSDNPFFENILRKVNTSFDELGPYRYIQAHSDSNYFFYANNSSGNFDIFFVPFDSYYNSGDIKKFNKINSDFDEFYPSIYDSGQKLMFCSNRDNNQFDIFEIPFSIKILDSISSETPTIQKLSVLNSNKDDKCPFTLDIRNKPGTKIMVFTSNREGGQGGYDLYFSIKQDGEWSDPVNLGPQINTSSDEYRPILLDYLNTDSLVMIFSSNRPGGVGGFDLYAVRVKFLQINPSTIAKKI